MSETIAKSLHEQDTTDEQLSVIIPTTAADVPTVDSIPEGYPISIERDGTLNEARNRGVSESDTEYVVIMDDDLRFDSSLLDALKERVDPTTVLGLADWDFGLLAGRVMCFHRNVWQDVGGFDERLKSHMGDTAFALAVNRAGYDLERLPRELLYHEPHERTITTKDRAWRLGYLSAKFPTKAATLAKGALL